MRKFTHIKEDNSTIIESFIPIEIWYSVQNGGDGSAYPTFFLTEEETEYDQENLYEGWGETCNGMIQTYIGSNVHKQAVRNSREQKNLREF